MRTTFACLDVETLWNRSESVPDNLKRRGQKYRPNKI